MRLIPQTTDGQWIRYPQGKSHTPLVKSLKGKATGWCIAGAKTAKEYLGGGDIYIYYTKDHLGETNVPRLAIAMEGDQISEIRGVGPDQNLDVEIAKSDVLQKKLTEFGEKGAEYYKKSKDMALLTEIERKDKDRIELTDSEIRFLYELDEQIKGFGASKDPRIKLLQDARYQKDLSKLFKICPEEITSRQSSLMDPHSEKKIKVFYGDLVFYMPPNREFFVPEIIIGNLEINYTYVKTNPEYSQRMARLVTGDLTLKSLPRNYAGDIPEVKKKLLIFSDYPIDGIKFQKSPMQGFELIAPSLRNVVLPERLDFVTLYRIQEGANITLPRKANRIDLGSNGLNIVIFPEGIQADYLAASLNKSEAASVPAGIRIVRYHDGESTGQRINGQFIKD